MSFLPKPFKLFILGTCLLFTSPLTIFSETPTSQKEADSLKTAIKFNEWHYYPLSNPPTLMWWNDRMAEAAPVLYISFTPEKITLNAMTPLWPNTGIIFYLNDKTEKQGVNLILQKRDQKHCYYSATIDFENRQNFVNNLVTSRKARLITPISSQSLSLKQMDAAMQLLLSKHPELKLSLPQQNTTRN